MYNCSQEIFAKSDIEYVVTQSTQKLFLSKWKTNQGVWIKS